MQSINGTVSWGIVGCGDVCEVKSGPAFNKVPNSRLVAVMRRDAEKVKDFADRHGVPHFYTDAKQLISDPDVNAIYIATPPALHEQYTEWALQAGKPVYVEKPVALDAASCWRMMQWEKEYQQRVSVAHYRRGLSLFRTVKELIKEGIIGRPRLIKIETLQPASKQNPHRSADAWRLNPDISGGGLFHDLAPHQLDILYWIFGEPGDVYIRTANQGKEYQVPDLTILNAGFANDLYLDGLWSFSVAEEASRDICEIIGDEGVIRFSFFRPAPIELITKNGTRILEREFPVNVQHPHIENVVRYFRGEEENPCSLQDALVIMNILDKARG